MSKPRQVIPFSRSATEASAPPANGRPDLARQTAAAAGYGDSFPAWKKHWGPDDFAVLSRREEADFSALLRKAGVELPEAARVLDVGFGNGAFLEFGRRRRWRMHGTEVNRGLLHCAAGNGFQVTRAETLESFPSQAFNMVAAFDVMEHIPLEALPGFLIEVRRVLKPDGCFLARFPNGDSPFARHIQNGDVTHKTAIGSIRARFLANQADMEIVLLDGEVQAILAGPIDTPHRLFAVPIKKLMNAFFNLIFSPRNPLPFCAPNLHLVLRRPGL